MDNNLESSAFNKVDVPHPPTSFDEFLKYERLVEWPQRLTREGILDFSDVKPPIPTLEDIRDELAASAPFGLEALDAMEVGLDDFSYRLDYFSSFITSPENLPSRIPDNLFHAPRQEFLDKAADYDAVKLHHSRRKKKKDAKEEMKEAEQAMKTRDINFVNFPGFRMKELTELPSQLEAPQLLNKITGAQTFNKGFKQLWKKIFLSEASIAIFQDAFWWIFLENFEHNSTAQDKLFTRIADSYTVMFCSVHPDIRDKFFVEYPRCLAQCIYLTFWEAFPQSLDHLGEQFVAEIYSVVSEWASGVKPPVNEWKRWPWEKLNIYPGSGAGDNIIKHDREGGLMGRLTDLDFGLDLVSEDSHAPNSGNYVTRPSTHVTDDIIRSGKHQERKSNPGSTEVQTKMRFNPPKDSAQAGPGPDFERVLFNLGGRSPLVAHHLYMKQLRDKGNVGKVMRRTEMLREPPPGMTFNEVITKSQKTMKSLHEQRDKSELSAQQDIARVRHHKKQAIKEIESLKKSLTDPLEIKIRSDKVLDQALEKGLHRPTSYAGQRHSNLTKNDGSM